MATAVIAAEIEPQPDRARQAAAAMQRLGFRVLHIGPTISVQGPQPLWEATFNVAFQPQRKRVVAEIEEGGEVTYQQAITEHLRIPEGLRDLLAAVMFVEPPEFFSTP